MKVLVYTLTRDRLEYTKRMFKQLKETAGVDYDHVVLDNGSTDGTPQWLDTQKLHKLIKMDENVGLWKGIQRIIEETNRFRGYDYVIKIDNDMEFPQNNWLKELLRVHRTRDFDVISPFVEGICNGEGGPRRLFPEIYPIEGVSLVGHVGGAALLTTPKWYDEDLPLDRPKAQGWDTWFCMGLKCGIVEDIKVKHDTALQEKTMPEYYARKVKESEV